eukprot:jgi/Mesvir1/29663/Mv21504-RA.1
MAVGAAGPGASVSASASAMTAADLELLGDILAGDSVQVEASGKSGEKAAGESKGEDEDEEEDGEEEEFITVDDELVDPAQARSILAMDALARVRKLREALKDGDSGTAAAILAVKPDVVNEPDSSLFPCLYSTPRYLRKRMASLLTESRANPHELLLPDGGVEGLKGTVVARGAPTGTGVGVGGAADEPTRPLHVLAELGLDKAVADLVAAGANVNARGGPDLQTPLLLALANGHTSLVHQLVATEGLDVNVKDCLGRTAIMYALSAGVVAHVYELVERGADLFLTDSEGRGALHLAAEQDTPEMLDWLLDTLGKKKGKLDVEIADRDNVTPFFLCCRQGYIDAIVHMLDYGVNIERQCTSTGRTCLLEAAKHGHLRVVRTLLDKGALVTVTDTAGRTVLHELASCAHEDLDTALALVREVVEKGVKLNSQDTNRNTALHDACACGQLRMVVLLLDLGANMMMENGAGLSPLQQACEAGSLDVVLLLLDNGKVPDKVQAMMLEVAARNSLHSMDPSPARLLDTVSSLCYPVHRSLQLDAIFTRLSEDVSNNAATQECDAMQHGYEVLALDLMKGCRSKEDEEELMKWKFFDGKTTVIDLAMAANHKAFVAHTITQQQLEYQWGTGYPLQILIPCYFLFVVLLPLAYLKEWHEERQSRRMASRRERIPNTPSAPLSPKSRTMTVRRSRPTFSKTQSWLQLPSVEEMVAFYHVPKVKFCGFAGSYLAFLIIMVFNLDDDVRDGMTAQLWLIALWVAGIFLRNVTTFMLSESSRKYFGQFWNVVDIVNAILFAVFYVMMYTNREIASHVLAFAYAVSIIRFLTTFQASYFLGPLELMIRRMLLDVLRFMSILSIFVLALTCALTKLYSIEMKDRHLDTHGLKRSAELAYWALYAVFALPDLDAKDRNVQLLARALVAIYCLVAIVVLLNLLIALMSSTFQRIHDNTDMEFRFAKAKLIRNQSFYPPMPVPLNIVYLVLVQIFTGPVAWVRRLLNRNRLMAEEVDTHPVGYDPLNTLGGHSRHKGQGPLATHLVKRCKEMYERMGLRDTDGHVVGPEAAGQARTTAQSRAALAALETGETLVIVKNLEEQLRLLRQDMERMMVPAPVEPRDVAAISKHVARIRKAALKPALPAAARPRK